VQSTDSQLMFQRNISPLSSRPKNKLSKKPTWMLCLPPAFTSVTCSAYSSALKIEVICFSEMFVDFHWIKWHYIPEDSTLHFKPLISWYLYMLEFMQYHAVNIGGEIKSETDMFQGEEPWAASCLCREVLKLLIRDCNSL
jgi:hypothetical protein